MEKIVKSNEVATKVAEAKAKAEEVKKAKAEAKKASKQAEALKAKAEASEASKAEAKKAEAEAKRKAEALAKAEALETKAKAEAEEAKKAEKERNTFLTLSAHSLCVKAEAERKSLNASIRSLLESAKDCTEGEAEALLLFVGREVPKGSKAIMKAVSEVKKEEILSAYRDFSAYALKGEEGRKKVAKAVRIYPDCNAFTFEESTSFNIRAIFESPASNRRRRISQNLMEAGKYYEKAKGGKYVEIPKAEAIARQMEAKRKAEAEAERKAKEEAQREADRKAGEKARKEAEKAKKPEK